MKISNILTEWHPVKPNYKKSWADKLAVFVGNGMFYVIEDVPAITKQQFFELCKVSGFDKHLYDSDIGPELLQMCRPGEVDEELKDRFRFENQPSGVRFFTWKQFVKEINQFLGDENELD